MIWFQGKRWPLKSEPQESTCDSLRDHLLLLLLTARLLIAVLPERKCPGGLLGYMCPGLHGAVLAKNCLQQEARREIPSLTSLPTPFPASSSKSGVAQERCKGQARDPLSGYTPRLPSQGTEALDLPVSCCSFEQTPHPSLTHPDPQGAQASIRGKYLVN